ncbi:hypothetical protein [Halostagnicola sp. A56]|uniref:hypothetical protein n=1 Tax=Halostagnicola sp. A56 TaxID=1495067 RepID=UPI0004A16268|nr:hypothetical protein [Halostagnicola sp. A56]
MAEEGRALMTEREREIIAGDADVTSNYRYKVQSLVRNRVRKQFSDDIDVLREDFTEVYEMVTDDACGALSEDVRNLETRLADVQAELDQIEEAFERGDSDAARGALDQAQEALSEGDPNV